MPVEWKGTAEVKEGYGGSETIHPSFLPARNPEVMYFALGQVSASTLHGLFDRKSDTAIRFSAETRMTRDPKDADLLDLTMPVPGNTLVRLLPDYYAKTLGVPFYAPFDDSRFKRAAGDLVQLDGVLRRRQGRGHRPQRRLARRQPEDYGFNYVQLDDGYDRGPKGEHYWIEKWDTTKFPHGPKWLTAYIKSKGLHPGLWLVPNAYAGAVEQHPDWYLRDTKGEIIRDYNTPALDSTHPSVQDFLRKLFTTLGRLGVRVLQVRRRARAPAVRPERRSLPGCTTRPSIRSPPIASGSRSSARPSAPTRSSRAARPARR